MLARHRAGDPILPKVPVGLAQIVALNRSVRMIALVGAAALMYGCGPQARPANSSTAAPATVGPTTAPVQGAGYLEGRASIGPLQPVERVGVPAPSPSPAACTARGLVVTDAQTGSESARFDLQPDCTFRVALFPGTYRVELQRRGIDSSKDLPQTVTIANGQTTRLDISIDTGIR